MAIAKMCYNVNFTHRMSLIVSIRQLWICPPRSVQLTKVAGVIVVSDSVFCVVLNDYTCTFLSHRFFLTFSLAIGYLGIVQQQCEDNHGCCWSSSNTDVSLNRSNVKFITYHHFSFQGVPWCFSMVDAPVQVCLSDQPRTDCGNIYNIP